MMDTAPHIETHDDIGRSSTEVYNAGDEIFVDASDCLAFVEDSSTPPVDETPTARKYPKHPSPNSPASNYGTLERCGRWLTSIPRDDVVALQNTSEYRDFLFAFDRLGEAHRRTVTLERRHLLETEEADLVSSPSANTHTGSNIASCANSTLSIPPFTRFQPMSSPDSARRRHYSFLQHLADDDVLLRIFEFINCSSLVRTGTTCHRFHELTNRSAAQRTHRLVDGRLLRSAMKMLRAQEQIEGVDISEEMPFVPIPVIGLKRRVIVSGAGDPEFNGIYFCTGSNGNGYLFTKPRVPERRVRFENGVVVQSIVGRVPMQQPNVEVEEDQDEREIADIADAIVDVMDEDNNGIADQRDGGVDILFGDEPNRSRLLRCVIAKRFSNETLLWYMSKETEDETTHEISQHYSFWGRLMVTGDASPEVCKYPSQTSLLSRNGEPAWSSLTPNNDVAPPIVELLDA
eukprot:g10042.t1 g10042   contig4:1112616-1113995(-)